MDDAVLESCFAKAEAPFVCEPPRPPSISPSNLNGVAGFTLAPREQASQTCFPSSSDLLLDGSEERWRPLDEYWCDLRIVNTAVLILPTAKAFLTGIHVQTICQTKNGQHSLRDQAQPPSLALTPAALFRHSSVVVRLGKTGSALGVFRSSHSHNIQEWTSEVNQIEFYGSR
ncbi:hypothetical protein A9K55_007331 [Cordyceps militaris]|uniref:Uncharacterized protein n=1 Tax=Cordyceps militaris TaxID=73501 RepID=A0A2H4SJK2_CORMI|nr:hypothetical protein A9K55_007331 [Cordyceps militaris]